MELKMGLSKMWLNVNGAKRMLICDPDKDTLAAALRRLGLLGVKVGCNAGQCGSCSVLLDGEVVRSCAKKMKNVPEYANVTTIEGIGTPTNLHPLQQAWITYGGIQCGFCTPGFIVSAKGLLDKNPSPTRTEVRAWFQKNKNLCRCTGYAPLVDAVMAAAKVIRGESTMEDITYKVPADGKIYGTRFPRPESGVARACGLANYGEDMTALMPDDTLHLAVVMPMVAHANIKLIDDTEALKMPGVVKVITAKDVKGTNRHALPMSHPRAKNPGLHWPIICDTKISRFGDVVAVVAADTRENAREAAKAVRVELEPLPEYATALEAILPDSVPIHDDLPNLFLTSPLHKGEDTRDVFSKADYVVEGSFHSGREPHLSIEPDVVQAYMGADGMLTVHSKAQWVYGTQMMIAAGVGLPAEKIRVVENVAGGAFGYAVGPPSAGVAAVCALATGRPVSLVFSYPEHQWFTGKRAASYSNARLAANKDGKIQGLEYDTLLDVGGYAYFAEVYLEKSFTLYGFPYSIPNIMGLMNTAHSNISYGTPYRAFAAVQASVPSESLVDMMAEKIGMDPFEFRYKNIARPGDLMSTGCPYHEYPLEEMMTMLRPKYEAMVAKAKKESTPEKKRGVGFALYGYLTGWANDSAQVDLELCSDGTIVNYNTWEDVGQHAEGSALLHTYEALRPLNVPLKKIKLVMNDTKLCPDTGLSGASRQHYMCGKATIDAADKLMEAMRKPDGTFRTYDEMTAEGIPTRYRGTGSTRSEIGVLDANNAQGDAFPEHMFVAFLSEVEVDVTTGRTKVLALKVLADVGVIGNLQGVEGQAYSGLSHNVGFALKTDFRDMKKHSTMVGAGITECEDMPDDIELMFHETYRKHGPHGSGGAAESFQSAGHVSVLNAINNAVGVRITELPATPEKVKAGIEAKARGEEIKTAKYYLGHDFYEEIDSLAKQPAYWDAEHEGIGA
jgi:aldehyde oxidoreductase